MSDFPASHTDERFCRCVVCTLERGETWVGEYAEIAPQRIDPRQNVKPRQPVSAVDHPPHYTAHPSGIECIQVTEHMGFNLGNAVKYIWRADLKGAAIEDLEKATWYLQREIARLKAPA